MSCCIFPEECEELGASSAVEEFAKAFDFEAESRPEGWERRGRPEVRALAREVQEFTVLSVCTGESSDVPFPESE